MIAVSGQKLEFTNLNPSEVHNATYWITQEGDYAVEVEFQSGKRLKKNVGYITRGINMHHELVVTDSDIEVSGGVGDRRKSPQ